MYQVVSAAFLVVLAGFSQAGPPAASPNPGSVKPFGPYYCQARCQASCLESSLATTVEECERFCPPFFEDNMPCPADDAKCWSTCGVPTLANQQPAPESPVLTPVNSQGEDEDPFVIELAWNASTNATLYIVEFFPHNRAPKPGESNFFQVMTTSLAYKVRKDDECVEYSGRVIAVNSYGISTPSYLTIGAPSPTMRSNQLAVRNIQRDPQSSDMITATIDYIFPGWPALDVDIEIRVTATDCKGKFGDRTFPTPGASPSAVLNPSYNAIIGKAPTTAILLSFFDDVLLADCLIQMKVASLSTRCNTSTSYEDNMAAAPGIEFRINCDTVVGACDNSTTPDAPLPPQAPIPVPLTIAVDPDVVVPPVGINTPSHVPPGIQRPPAPVDETQDMPQPPTLPLFAMGPPADDPTIPQPMPPGGRVSVIDMSENGTSVETISIIPESMLPPLCELEMLDVEPSISSISNSVIDLKVLWLERQPLPPPPPAQYFAIRYGPIVRKLVDDNREPNDIIPGYETIVHTGQQAEMPFLPDPTREINITSIQRGSLLTVQICAIFDPNSEPLIAWDTVQSRRIDLAALEPFLELDGPQSPPQPSDDLSPFDIQNMAGASVADMSPISPVLVPFDPPMQPDVQPDVPLLISVNVEPTTPSTTYWLTIAAGILIMVLTLLLILLFIRRLCTSRRVKKVQNQPMYVVSTVPTPPPVYKEEVKVPLP